MPFPRPTDKRLLQHHLVVIMINLTVEYLFERLDNTQAADKRAVNVVFKHVGQPELAGARLRIATLESLLFQSPIILRDTDQQLHLFGVKKRRLHEVTIAVEL